MKNYKLSVLKNWNRGWPLLLIIACTICCQKENSESQTSSFDGLPLAYSVHGSEGPVVLFVHGWCSDRQYWDDQIPQFSRDFQMVTMDLGGHGKSGLSRSRWILEDFGRDAAAVVNAVTDGPVILVGHSMGGLAVLEAARVLGERVTAIVGVDCYQNLSTGISSEETESMMIPMKEDFTGFTLEYIKTLFPDHANPYIVDHVSADISSGPKKVGMDAMASLLMYNRRQALSAVDVPIYVINGGLIPQDEELTKQILPRLKIVVMPQAGHFPMLEYPEEFNRHLLDILDDIRIRQSTR